MIVYADVLIFLNTIINFYLLLLTKKLGRNEEKLFRLVCGAFIGALFSLYIFLPNQNIFTEIAVRLICAALITVVCFGFKGLRAYLRNLIIFFTVSFVFAGVMLGIWLMFKPGGMVIHNSVVYFNLSPFLLILLSFVFYFFILFVQRFFIKKTSEKRLCNIKIVCKNNVLQTVALVDSGHNITDLLSDKDIIFISQSKGLSLFGKIDPLALSEEYEKRFRIIPCNTVNLSGTLSAIRCDLAEISYENSVYKINSPIVAVAKSEFGEDHSAIISPALIEKC